MPRNILLIGIVLLILPLATLAADAASPHLFSEEVSLFPGIEEAFVEQTLVVKGRGSVMKILYTSDQPLTLQVSYLVDRGGSMSFDPLASLRIDSVSAGENRELTIDLTRSPAWNNSREVHLLHVQGPDGATMQIHDIDVIPATLFDSLGAIAHHLAVQEPMQLSSINFLHGYRILGVSLSVILGFIILFLLVIKVIIRKRKYALVYSPIFLPLFFIAFFLYDARFSFDLMSVTARDTNQWLTDHEYRQLGPLHEIVDELKQEQTSFRKMMSVALCFPWDDIYLKQLRYHLYPIPVERAERSLDTATHLVFLGMEHTLTNGMIACTKDQKPREAELLRDFSRGSAIYRLSPPRS